MNDKPPFGRAAAIPAHRLTRSARMIGFASQVVGRITVDSVKELSTGRRPNLPSLLLSPRNIQHLTHELSRMRGAAMKLGQILSMDAGSVLPPELAEMLSRLRADADFMPPAQLKKVLTAQWGKTWLPAFRRFDVNPIAAASIGQVHKAELKDGREVAIKVQYPGVARSIDSDLKTAARLIKSTRLLPPEFDLNPYLETARNQLHEETDYMREATQLEMFSDLLSEHPQIGVPKVHRDWSTSSILTMSFEHGIAIDQLETEAQPVRDSVMTCLFDLFFREIFDFKRIQSDPNFANYLYQPENGRVALLDFGATRILDADLVAQLRELGIAGLWGEELPLREAAEALGVLVSSQSQSDQMQILRILTYAFAALCNRDLFDFAHTDVMDRVQTDLLSLAQSGMAPPPVPMDVLYIQRKLGGLVLLATRLKARVPLKNMATQHLHP